MGDEELAGQRRQRVIRFDPFQQRLDPADPCSGNQPKLGRVAADGIGELGALADQPIAQAHQHQGRLLLRGLDRYEAHGWPAHRLTQRLGVGGIVLATFNVRLDELGWEHSHLVTQRLQQARPVVRPAAGLDPDHRGWKLREEGHHVLAP
jgi:hypothetical protein